MKTNFEMVAAMNVAFGNPQGNINKVSLSRIKNQVKNIPDEVGELFIALGADKYMTQDAVAHLKWLLARLNALTAAGPADWAAARISSDSAP